MGAGVFRVPMETLASRGTEKLIISDTNLSLSLSAEVVCVCVFAAGGSPDSQLPPCAAAAAGAELPSVQLTLSGRYRKLKDLAMIASSRIYIYVCGERERKIKVREAACG